MQQKEVVGSATQELRRVTSHDMARIVNRNLWMTRSDETPRPKGTLICNHGRKEAEQDQARKVVALSREQGDQQEDQGEAEADDSVEAMAGGSSI